MWEITVKISQNIVNALGQISTHNEMKLRVPTTNQNYYALEKFS